MKDHAVLNGFMLVGGCADREPYHTQLLYFTCSSLSRHESDWLGQDAHPHPIYSHPRELLARIKATHDSFFDFCSGMYYNKKIKQRK